MCVPTKVRGESSDVNIQVFLCVTKELTIRTGTGTGEGGPGRPGNEAFKPPPDLERRKEQTDDWDPRRKQRQEEEKASTHRPKRHPTVPSPQNQPASISGVRLKHETETKHSSTRGHKDSERRTR